MDGNSHYIRIDSNNIIIAAFSDAFQAATPTDILIESNAGRHYNPIITDGQGTFIYKWNGTQMVDRTQDLDYLLPIAKNNKLDELQTARDAAIYSTFQSSALGNLKTYSYNKEAYENFRGKTALLAVSPNITTVMWATIEDGFVSHTRDQYVQVVTDGGAHEETLKMKYYNLELQTRAAQTVAQVTAIVW